MIPNAPVGGGWNRPFYQAFITDRRGRIGGGPHPFSFSFSFILFSLLMPLLVGCSIRTNQYKYDSFSDKGVECTLVIRQKVIPGFFVFSSPWYTWGRTIVLNRGENVYVRAVDEKVQSAMYLGGNTILVFYSNNIYKNGRKEHEVGFIDITDSESLVSWVGFLPQALNPVDNLTENFGEVYSERRIFSSIGDMILIQNGDMNDSFFWLCSDKSIVPVAFRMPHRLEGYAFLYEGENPGGEPYLKRIKSSSFGRRHEIEDAGNSDQTKEGRAVGEDDTKPVDRRLPDQSPKLP